MKSLLEIEEAIAELPAKTRRQFVRKIPALRPGEFPADGWDAILNEAAPRRALFSPPDKLDAEHSHLSGSNDYESSTSKRLGIPGSRHHSSRIG